ncbi:hypothetical protein Nit79A3_1425 [Nitrosomonas sp. Is79A3]|uniref:hypothetical protein n=1 Tax=Nitrosomonas sp. (strain Is79A3) TaxID=261292 RepID=UPI000215CFF2
MKTFKTLIVLCLLGVLLGILQVVGMRFGQTIWPEETLHVVHYLCIEGDDGDVACGKIKDLDLAKKIKQGKTL